MEDYLENTPDIPNHYIKYLTDQDTAIADNSSSLFYETDILSESWDSEIYIPANVDGNNITPHEINGKITGFFDIDGNGTAEVIIYYKNIETGEWYSRNTIIVGSVVEFTFADLLNAEPDTEITPSVRVHSSEGTFLTSGVGQFSTDNGNTWSNGGVFYNHNNTLYRETIRTGSSFAQIYSHDVTINGVTRPFNYVTRMPNKPAFSENSFTFFIDEAGQPTIVGTVYPDLSSENVTLELVGDDADLFSIDSNGLITTIADLDYETPTDTGSDNTYVFSVVADNEHYQTSIPVSVIVEDVQEIPPILEDPGLLTVSENQAGSWGLSLLQGSNPITFSIEETKDYEHFDIDPETGVLVSVGTFNWENPSDSDSDNRYEIDVTVTNLYGFQTISLNIDVLNVIEDSIPDLVSYGNIESVTPGNSFYVTAPISGMENGASVTVTNGELSNDNGNTWGSSVSFVDGSTLVRLSVTAPNEYERTLSYSSVVNGVVISGSLRTLNTPVDLPATLSFNIDEGIRDIGQVVVLAGYGDISFEVVGGSDGSLFEVTNNGLLRFNTDTDFHSPDDLDQDNIYDLRVRAFNGETEDFVDITVTVENVILPIRMPRSRYFRFTDQATAVGSISPIESDDILTYAITGGPDAGLFDIDPVSGAISFKAQADFENPNDANGDNKYLFTVTLSNPLYSDSTSVRVDLVSSAVIPSAGRDKFSRAITASLASGYNKDSVSYGIQGITV